MTGLSLALHLQTSLARKERYPDGQVSVGIEDKEGHSRLILCP